MHYNRLTKEQFEELHQEFAKFLAAQSITADTWNKLKTEKPELAEQQLDIFSDLIWESVLKKAKYLENTSPGQMFLFKLGETEMHLIVVKVQDAAVDITSEEGFKWLTLNIKSDKVEFFTASKAYSEEKNKDIFDLIMQGAEISEGELYEVFFKLL